MSGVREERSDEHGRGRHDRRHGAGLRRVLRRLRRLPAGGRAGRRRLRRRPVPRGGPGARRLLPQPRRRRPAAGEPRWPAGRPRRRGRVPPGERGATRIADRVVAKIAAQAAREALAAPPPDAAPPHATVIVHHETAPRPRQPRARLPLRHRWPVRCGASPGHRAGRGVGGNGGARGGRPGRAAALRRTRTARHRGGRDERAPGLRRHREHPTTAGPREDRHGGTRPTTTGPGQSASAAAYDPCPSSTARTAGRPLLVRAQSPRGHPRAAAPRRARALLLYDVAAVRADRPAMAWRRVPGPAARRTAPRRHLGARRRRDRRAPRPLAARCSPSTPGLRGVLPMRRAHRRRPGRTPPGRRRAGAARPGHGGVRRAVRTGPDGPDEGRRPRGRPTSANSTTYGPTWTPRSPTASGGWACPGRPPWRCTYAGPAEKG